MEASAASTTKAAPRTPINKIDKKDGNADKGPVTDEKDGNADILTMDMDSDKDEVWMKDADEKDEVINKTDGNADSAKPEPPIVHSAPVTAKKGAVEAPDTEKKDSDAPVTEKKGASEAPVTEKKDSNAPATEKKDSNAPATEKCFTLQGKAVMLPTEIARRIKKCFTDQTGELLRGSAEYPVQVEAAVSAETGRPVPPPKLPAKKAPPTVADQKVTEKKDSGAPVAEVLYIYIHHFF